MVAVSSIQYPKTYTPLHEDVIKKKAPPRQIPNPLGLPGQPGKKPMVSSPFYKDSDGQLQIIA